MSQFIRRPRNNAVAFRTIVDSPRASFKKTIDSQHGAFPVFRIQVIPVVPPEKASRRRYAQTIFSSRYEDAVCGHFDRARPRDQPSGGRLRTSGDETPHVGSGAARFRMLSSTIGQRGKRPWRVAADLRAGRAPGALRTGRARRAARPRRNAQVRRRKLAYGDYENEDGDKQRRNHEKPPHRKLWRRRRQTDSIPATRRARAIFASAAP